MKTEVFLQKLQAEASFQADLHRTSVLPKQLDPLTALVGHYPWQVILVASGLMALLLELLS
jgi:hypothetical protein